jgi:hypothetical protein
VSVLFTLTFQKPLDSFWFSGDEFPDVLDTPDCDSRTEFDRLWIESGLNSCPPGTLGDGNNGRDRRLCLGRTDDLAESEITGFR